MRSSRGEWEYNSRSEDVKQMSKVAVVYWSGTGNTEAMADAVMEGSSSAGYETEKIEAGNFTADQVKDYDAIAFGCPAMGSEELEDSEVEPMFSDVEGNLKDRRIALFGSYGWGDGEWMRNWEERAKKDGAVLTHDSVICEETPDEDALKACRELGKSLV